MVVADSGRASADGGGEYPQMFGMDVQKLTTAYHHQDRINKVKDATRKSSKVDAGWDDFRSSKDHQHCSCTRELNLAPATVPSTNVC